MSKECEGCISYDYDEEYCPFQGDENEQCPCSDCILKSVCEAPCERFKLRPSRIRRNK